MVGGGRLLASAPVGVWGVCVADPVKIEVEGLKALSKALGAVDKGLSKELRLANKGAADVVRDKAKTLAPIVTGALRGSIGSRASQRSAAVKAGTAGRVPYAGAVIWGHRPRPLQGGYTEPNSFLIEAIGYEYEEIKRIYDRRVSKLAKDNL